MLKKTIKYTDFNGEEQTEDFYFNLTKAELLKMELSEKGGFNEVVNKIIASEEPQKIVELFEQMIQASYGVRSADGKRFTKSPELLSEFQSTQAYSELFVELATSDGAASAFVNGVVPADLAQQAQEAQEASARSSSELARERSQAQLQGHNTPQTKSEAQGSSFTNVPDIPTVTDVAPPAEASSDPIAESQEQELARLRAQLAARPTPATTPDMSQVPDTPAQ